MKARTLLKGIIAGAVLFGVCGGSAQAAIGERIEGYLVRAEVEAQERATFESCIEELQNELATLQLCMPQWAPEAETEPVEVTTTTAAPAAAPTTVAPAPATTVPTTVAPAPTTTVPAAPAVNCSDQNCVQNTITQWVKSTWGSYTALANYAVGDGVVVGRSERAFCGDHNMMNGCDGAQFRSDMTVMWEGLKSTQELSDTMMSLCGYSTTRCSALNWGAGSGEYKLTIDEQSSEMTIVTLTYITLSSFDASSSVGYNTWVDYAIAVNN